VAVTITTFSTFAGLLVAAGRLAGDPDILNRGEALAELAANPRALAAVLRDTGLAALAKEMARQAEEIAVHFTHPGRARDDAIALFWQVAPAAFADPDTAVLDPDAATDRMLAAIKAAHARDLTALAEQLFRAVAHRALTTILADPAFVEPHRWRDALCRHGIPIVTIR
jgi:hypothetical protein